MEKSSTPSREFLHRAAQVSALVAGILNIASAMLWSLGSLTFEQAVVSILLGPSVMALASQHYTAD